MKKKKEILLIVLFVISSIVIYECIDYSPVKNDFLKSKGRLINNTKTDKQEYFLLEDLERYPKVLKKYFEVCNYINKPKMKYSITKFHNVKFILNQDQKPLKIDYERINDAHKPNVLAFIDTKFFGIPFQGIDSYYNKEGSMKGILGKHFEIFDESGKDFFTGSLVTYLSECLIVPNAALEDHISWSEIDSTTLEAVLEYEGYKVKGLFHFNKNGELKKFTSNDRTSIDSSGKKTKAPWTAKFSEYVEDNGMRYPKHLQAIWHYKEGDSIYFDGEISSLTYGY